METTTSTTVETLNDLIQIHNDRIVGYEKALKELKPEDGDLRSLFLEMIDESRKDKMELGNEVQVAGGEIEEDTTNAGKIYRTWMDVKAVFTGHTRRVVLSNCEAGEDATQEAYDSALRTEGLPAYLAELVTTQRLKLKSSHDRIKSLRDTTE